MEKKKILFISTMYPNSLRPGTVVCHYFTKQWVSMGYDVKVIYIRSMFPRIYTDLARLFPKLALKYVGNHVEMDRNMSVLKEVKDGIPVYSMPIYKYVPHGKYPLRSINKCLNIIVGILKDENFTPDAIIGHFYNPTLEIVGRLRRLYPEAKTCVSLHELHPEVIKNCYPKNYKDIINGVDVIGFRSVPIKQRFEEMYGTEHKSFVCWSGTPEVYISTPRINERVFTDGPMKSFLYVGQTIKRKFPKETLEGVHKAMNGKDFSLTYVGSEDLGYAETKSYIDANGLEENVTFTGKVPREEIIKYYDKSDCFILISKWEVFGLVYLEAMSRGCITIAGRGEGMEGIIEHGVNGFFCEPGNATELADVIRHINNLSASEKKTISDNAIAKAKELSDFNVAKNYLDAVISA